MKPPTGSIRGRLQAVGLSEAEELCYATLVSLGSSTARRLSEQAGLAGGAVARLLRSLETKGLVSRTASSPRRYVPAPPEIAIENLAALRERELVEARLAAASLQRHFREAPRQTAEDLVEVVLGREAVIQRYSALQTGARKSVEALIKPPYVSSMTDNRAELDGLARGVRLRLLYAAPLLELPEQLDVIKTFHAAGAQLRVLPNVPTKLAIYDRRYGYLAYTAQADEAEAGALLIRPSPLLDALILLFEQLWDGAVPFMGSLQNKGIPELSAEDETVLTLLAAGLKDEAIAGRLRVGHRTVQRKVARLMATLGAHTRFQAGLQAHSRGWITSG